MPSEPQSERTRRSLHAAVLQCVARRGLRATGVGDVLKEAGLDRETFYGAFTSLSECFETAAAEARARVVRSFDPTRAPGRDEQERRANALAAGLQALAADTALATCLFIESVYVRESPSANAAPRVLDGPIHAAMDGEELAPGYLNGYLAAVEQRIRDEVAAGRADRLGDLHGELVALGDRLLR